MFLFLFVKIIEKAEKENENKSNVQNSNGVKRLGSGRSFLTEGGGEVRACRIRVTLKWSGGVGSHKIASIFISLPFKQKTGENEMRSLPGQDERFSNLIKFAFSLLLLTIK